MNGLEVHDIHKSFGQTRALQGVSFQVAAGEIMAVLGPSGCGKSTLLAVIAGLETPDRGEVYWDGQPLAGVPPHQRGFGLMFQDFALFPHMNVAQNVAFGLRMAGMQPAAIRQRVAEVLDLVGLPGYEERDVSTLSGGESQRVALARSLAPHPRLLMLDEPLGSLDRTLRDRLLGELHTILRNMSQTALYVTHDQEEAFALADRVVLMNAGRVVQSGTPHAIYRQPASTFVARFLGLTNLLPAAVRHQDSGAVVDTPIGTFPAPGATPREAATALLRPDSVRLDGEGACVLDGTLVERSFRGPVYRAVVEVQGVHLTFELPATTSLPPEGSHLRISFDPSRAVQLFDPEGEAVSTW